MEQQINWADGYYIGKEFAEDGETENIKLEILFYSPAILEPFEFYLYDTKIEAIHQNGFLVVSYNKTLSIKLINDLRAGKSEQFIIGYISKYLPQINKEILKQRYFYGHFLVRTYSTLDIYKIFLNIEEKFSVAKQEKILLAWPQSITSFPPAKALAQSEDEIYIRDFIDAGNAYLTGSYDDCIRKAITSVENSFKFYGLKGFSPRGLRRFFHPFRKSKFQDIVKQNIYKNDVGHKILVENILFIYDLRNKIVHDKFRVNPKNGWICKKAIGTLNYIYQSLGRGSKSTEYIFYLSQQFLMLDNFTKGIDLDYMKRSDDEEFNDSKIIDSPQKMDEFIFNGLKISKKEQDAILKK